MNHQPCIPWSTRNSQLRKLLGWMHRKFKQNSNNHEPPKEFSIGQPLLDELQTYSRGSNCSKPFSKAQRGNHYGNSYTNLNIATLEDDYNEDQTDELTELFHGFLAIGTLGTELMGMGPATPKFSTSVDHIAENETEVTEDELKLFNDELEKVLGAEGRDDISSGRDSHVSGQRISSCSSVTLSGMPRESADSRGSGATICPLQSYLLGSATESPEKPAPVKKEHRTSLRELFEKTKLTDEDYGNKSDEAEKRVEKETDKSALHLMKKVLKKRLLKAATAEKKLHKIKHIFSRKVHPEGSLLHGQSHNSTTNEIKNNTHWMASNDEALQPSGDDITIYPQGTTQNERKFSFKSNRGDSGNQFWIKTDGDYLVLEL